MKSAKVRRNRYGEIVSTKHYEINLADCNKSIDLNIEELKILLQVWLITRNEEYEMVLIRIVKQFNYKTIREACKRNKLL